MKKRVGNGYVIDYDNPPVLQLKGEAGKKAYIKILTTPPVEYDHDKEVARAAEKLRKQGVNVK